MTKQNIIKLTMVKAWKHQKELKKQDIPSHAEIIQMAEDIKDLRLRALLVLVYLTAGRINEIVKSSQRKDFILTEKDGRKVLLITLANEKNPKRTIKKIPIPVDRDRKLLNFLIEYLNTLESSETLLFNFTHSWAYKLLRKAVDINPHFFRHIRLTHLVTEYDFNEQLLKMYAGWTDTRPAKYYMELRWTDILQKL